MVDRFIEMPAAELEAIVAKDVANAPAREAAKAHLDSILSETFVRPVGPSQVPLDEHEPDDRDEA